MSKRTREEEEEEDTERRPTKALKQEEGVENGLESGYLAMIPPEIRTLIWRMLDYDHVAWLSLTCPWLCRELAPNALPPPMVPPREIEMAKPDIRQGFFDLVQAAIHFGIASLRPSECHLTTSLFPSILCRWRKGDCHVLMTWRLESTSSGMTVSVGAWEALQSGWAVSYMTIPRKDIKRVFKSSPS